MKNATKEDFEEDVGLSFGDFIEKAKNLIYGDSINEELLEEIEEPLPEEDEVLPLEEESPLEEQERLNGDGDSVEAGKSPLEEEATLKGDSPKLPLQDEDVKESMPPQVEDSKEDARGVAVAAS